MLKAALVLAAVLAGAMPTLAATKQDCEQAKDRNLAIKACSQIIRSDPRAGWAYSSRGNAHLAKREHDRAIADFGKAIELDPNSATSYCGRGDAYRAKGDRDTAIADYTKAIELDPKYASAYKSRAGANGDRGERDRAIADYAKAIELDPNDAGPRNGRGIIHEKKREYDRAIADFSAAIELDPKWVLPYVNRANAQTLKGNREAAIADWSRAIELDPNYARAYHTRGIAYASKGERSRALADYRKVLDLPPTTAADRERHEIVRQRIARLTQPAPAPARAKRVALVIGNSNYAHAGLLTNPKNDARAMSAVLRRLDFGIVTEHYDLNREAMFRAIKEFGDRAEGAEWAVVFYAGHGLEMSGTTYLIPTDAELKRDSHVNDETLTLTHLQAKVDAASKLGLVILDACRSNPFLSRMVCTGGTGRAIGRGLSPVEPEGNVLVAYAAKHGTTADDGSGDHSPFTEALLAHIEEPGLEINFLFRKVRDQVRQMTARRQEPFLYGSLGSEPLYFKSAAR